MIVEFDGALRIERNSPAGMEIEVDGEDVGTAITEHFMQQGEVKYVARHVHISIEVNE